MSILVIIEERADIPCLITWGQRFARARDCSLIIAHVAQVRHARTSEQVPLLPEVNAGSIGIQAIRQFLDDDRSDQLDADTQTRDSLHRSQIPKLWDIHHANPQQELLRLLDQLSCSLCMMAKKDHGRNPVGAHDEMPSDVGSVLLRQAHCDVMLFRPARASHENVSRRMLIPVAGGAHTLAALRLADAVARQEDMIVSPLYVQTPAVGDAEAVAHFRLAEILKAASMSAGAHIENKIAVSKSVRDSINSAANEDCNLLIVGASDHHAVSKMLFGTIDTHVLSGTQHVSLAVIRCARPAHSRLRLALETFASSRIPQLDREQRVAFANKLSNGSVCNFDYLAMMCLSTLIAALGLLQDATAVVVGAMLVAPLMTPIIGAGLGLVQGNAQLIRRACKSIIYGFLVALLIGLVLGWIIPNAVMNSELLGRGNPNALDLCIALFSGVAAAYAMSRPNLSAALPGVAIAAALVPPIATVGISLALGDMANAQGAVLLFGTNVVAIILGSAVVLYVVGMRPASSGRSARLWAQRVLLSLIVCVIVFAVPLSSIYLATLGLRETQSITQTIEQHFHQHFHQNFQHNFHQHEQPQAAAAYHIQHISATEQDDGSVAVRIRISTTQTIDQASMDVLQRRVQASIRQDVSIELLRTPLEIMQSR